MASITLDEHDLVVHIRGLDALLAARRTFKVPLAHVAGARARPPEARFDDVIRDNNRGIGTYVHGRYAIGTVQFSSERERENRLGFYDVHDPERAIAIDLAVGKRVWLQDEPVTRVVVELDDETPESAVRRIEEALAARDEQRVPADWSPVTVDGLLGRESEGDRAARDARASEGASRDDAEAPGLRAMMARPRELALDALRIYLGVALFLQGTAFVGHVSRLVETMRETHVPWSSAWLAHFVAMAHIVGGLMLAAGMLTRLAAAIQIPVLLGAVLFVHRQEGLFTPQQTLELALLVLFMLMLFAIVGGGPLSVDAYAERARLRAPRRRATA